MWEQVVFTSSGRRKVGIDFVIIQRQQLKRVDGGHELHLYENEKHKVYHLDHSDIEYRVSCGGPRSLDAAVVSGVAGLLSDDGLWETRGDGWR